MGKVSKVLLLCTGVGVVFCIDGLLQLYITHVLQIISHYIVCTPAMTTTWVLLSRDWEGVLYHVWLLVHWPKVWMRES